MMPSRGLGSVARGNATRLLRLQSRNLTTTSRFLPQTPIRKPLGQSQLPLRWTASTLTPGASVSAIRHASTTSTSTAQGHLASAPTPPPADASSFPGIDSITLDTIDTLSPSEMAKIPEQIGYLHQLGLDFGTGPSSLLQWCLEHVHVYSGMPWWGSIAATAILFRLIMLPLYMKSSDMAAKQAGLNPLTKPLMAKLQDARREGDQAQMMSIYNQMSAIRKRAGISTFTMFTPALLQGVVAYCGFKVLRAMTELPVPAFPTDGFLWLADLTRPDPFLILPVAMAGLIHWIIRIGGETAATDTDLMNPLMFKFLLWGMPGVMIVFMGWQPGALVVWFAATTAMSVAQAFFLRSERVRNYFNLAPLFKPGKAEAARYTTESTPWSRLSADTSARTVEAEAAVDTDSEPATKSAHTYGYQAPSINRVSTQPQQSRVIDVVKGTSRSGESEADGIVSKAAQSGTPKGSVAHEAATAWKNVKQQHVIMSGQEASSKKSKPRKSGVRDEHPRKKQRS